MRLREVDVERPCGAVREAPRGRGAAASRSSAAGRPRPRHVGVRRTSQTAAAIDEQRRAATKRPASISWNVQKRPAGWYEIEALPAERDEVRVRVDARLLRVQDREILARRP